ncbi:murein biosynthesis integral membrane protein MurJ [Microbacterium invictum]|uniref:Murein biosynthesis integral membrane protein MurJ n=1 Tax=Microbacterium invictum TaxID=515415 RepID=A0ABZ0VB70_9MICO|nr:murein biosynthesis integral membrane protein MurJ [Microbacterium invictum]WQB70369.1 murein biosynthesis integral membrane protein MurJ [Microbacterium invictum]
MSDIGRASVLIGAGTIVSRLTGLLRNVVLVTAIGSVASQAGDAFATAISIPNSVYAIISAGLLTAVIVPQIVRAGAHPDTGQAFISKLVTLATIILLAATAVATVLAPWLVALYAPSYSAEQQALAVAFAYWLLPQILFFGLFALFGEILNARRVFGPYTWAPIVNNVVSIIGFLIFLALFGGPVSTVTSWTPQMIALLAGSATAGIVCQAGVLLIFWRRAGLRLRPDFRWRGVGLRGIGRLAGWTFLMVLVGQLAGFVQSRVMSEASGIGAAAQASANAWLIFMLPYSIIVLSIGTPYFTRLSEHATAGRDGDVRRDVVSSIRTLGLFTVVAAVAIAVAAVPASRIFTDDAAQAVEASAVLCAYLVSLVPLAVLFVVQRTFYAYDDTRTPFFFTLLQGGIVVGTAWTAGFLVQAGIIPLTLLAAAIALGQSSATLVQVIVAAVLLHRRMDGIGARSWTTALLTFALAALPAAAAGWGVYLATGGAAGWMVADKLLGALGAAVIGLVTLVVYLGVLALLRTPDLAPALGMVRRFLPGKR